MTNEAIWTKLVLERFIQLANLTEEEEIVIRTRAAGWSRVKQAMELNISISGIDRIISRLRKKYDEVQRLDPILPLGSSIFRNQPKQNSAGLNPEIIEQARQAMRGGPQMGKVLNMLSSNGASPEQMVRRICRERGIDGTAI